MADVLTLTRWTDPVVEATGVPVTARYVEVFWLPVLGPSAILLLRHAAVHTSHGPYVVDAEVLGKCLGVGCGSLMRTLDRLDQFGFASRSKSDTTRWSLRAHADRLPTRHLTRLPELLRVAHDELTEGSTHG